MSTCPVFQFLNMKRGVVTSRDSFELDMQLECRRSEFVISCKKLSIPENSAVLKDHPMKVQSVSFAFLPALLHEVQQCSGCLWCKEPAALNFINLTKFRRWELLSFMVLDAWLPTQFVASLSEPVMALKSSRMMSVSHKGHQFVWELDLSYNKSLAASYISVGAQTATREIKPKVCPGVTSKVVVKCWAVLW